MNRTSKNLRRLAGLVVSALITAVGEPVAICAVAIVLIFAGVMCWVIMDSDRSTRLTALVVAWRSAPRRSRESKVPELSSGSERANRPKRP